MKNWPVLLKILTFVSFNSNNLLVIWCAQKMDPETVLLYHVRRAGKRSGNLKNRSLDLKEI
jgi:hypothetical protein